MLNDATLLPKIEELGSPIGPLGAESLSIRVEDRVRRRTHGRIRDLNVEEFEGSIIVRGRAPSHHARQLALHGALELLSGEQATIRITVG